MFLEFFDWFCSCVSSVFDLMKKFTLFDGFTYFDLIVSLLAIPIIFKLFHFIMSIEDEESSFVTTPSDNYISQYDEKKRGRY